jgi:hypothetical protein
MDADRDRHKQRASARACPFLLLIDSFIFQHPHPIHFATHAVCHTEPMFLQAPARKETLFCSSIAQQRRPAMPHVFASSHLLGWAPQLTCSCTWRALTHTCRQATCCTATLLIVESSDFQCRCPSDIAIPGSPLTLSWIQMCRYAAFDTFQPEPRL